MFFSSLITKNLNQEFLTKNLVTLKRRIGFKDETLECYQGSLKNPIFRGKGHKKPIYKEVVKKGDLNNLHIFCRVNPVNENQQNRIS